MRTRVLRKKCNASLRISAIWVLYRKPLAAMVRGVITALVCSTGTALVVPLQPARPAQALDIALPRVSDGASVHLGDALAATTDRTLLCFGTHAAARASARESNVATGPVHDSIDLTLNG